MDVRPAVGQAHIWGSLSLPGLLRVRGGPSRGMPGRGAWAHRGHSISGRYADAVGYPPTSGQGRVGGSGGERCPRSQPFWRRPHLFHVDILLGAGLKQLDPHLQRTCRRLRLHHLALRVQSFLFPTGRQGRVSPPRRPAPPTGRRPTRPAPPPRRPASPRIRHTSSQFWLIS